MIIKAYYRLKDRITKTGAKWDLLAPTIENAIEFAHTYLNEDPVMYKMHDDNPTQFTLEYILADHGAETNHNFRTGTTCEVEKLMPDMIKNYTTKKDIVVYRGVWEDVYKLMLKNAKGHRGITHLEKGFLSTSLVKGCELPRPIYLRIWVPAGTHAIYQGNVIEEQHTYEVDIQHGAQLKIISISKEHEKEYINCKLIRTA